MLSANNTQTLIIVFTEYFYLSSLRIRSKGQHLQAEFVSVVSLIFLPQQNALRIVK